MSTSSTETLTRPDGSPVRVLVVDDEQMLADLLASALRYEGWEVTTAGTGIAAPPLATWATASCAGPCSSLLTAYSLRAHFYLMRPRPWSRSRRPRHNPPRR